MHTGAVEQRWAEIAWMCAATANSHRTSVNDPIAQPRDYNPLRLAEEASAAAAAGSRPPASRRGGLPLDPETIRAYHAALEARGGRRTGRRKRPGGQKDHNVRPSIPRK